LIHINATGRLADTDLCGVPGLGMIGRQRHAFDDNTAVNARSAVPDAGWNVGAAHKPIYMPSICRPGTRHIETIRRRA